jgi:hypothetical protein
MIKIPVGQTIRFAYAFTFEQIGTIIGLIWIPTVINAVGSFFVFGAYNTAMVQAGSSGNPAVAGPQFAMMLVYFFVAFFLVAMMAVAVTQQALGLRKGPALAHFSLGSAELRVFGGFFGLYIFFFLFVVVFALIVAAAGIVVGATVKGNAAAASVIGAGGGLLGMAAFAALIYMFVRLSFLFIPSAVSEGEFGLTRSWHLTMGNFWRILAVGLAVLMPLILIQGVAEYFILGPAYFTSIADSLRDTANVSRYSAVQAQIVEARMPFLLGMGLLIAPILQGLLFAPAAFAYRILAGKAAPQSNGKA